VTTRRFGRPYAQALFAVAGSVTKAAEVRDELARVVATLREVPALAAMVGNPVLPLAAKRQALARVAERMGVTPLTQRLLQSLLGRHRLARLDEVVATLTAMIDHRQGVGVAHVTTAEPLGEDERRDLQRVLEGKVGKRLQLDLAVDPRLLAGFVAQVDSQLFDGSLRGQLDRLAKELASA
jgi:F-type H+-transporting ATPase subunit delta